MAEPAEFVVAQAVPRYLDPTVQRSFPARLQWAEETLTCCRACPRECAVDRTGGELGDCGVGQRARVASAFPHFGEEACLSGARGSGTIFFSGCNLRCVFCQNWDISQRAAGREVDDAALAELMLSLQADDCHNINLVTPEHVVPQVCAALVHAVQGGLRLPVVYNTSAYDSPDSLRRLDGLIDIYMPDFKFWDPATAAALCGAADYPQRARAALREMHRQVGDLVCTPDGVAARGLLVRHLVMPGLVSESARIFEFLARELSANTYVNIMGQYRPEHEVGRVCPEPHQEGAECRLRHAQLNRRPTPAELRAARAAAQAAGLWRFAEK